MTLETSKRDCYCGAKDPSGHGHGTGRTKGLPPLGFCSSGSCNSGTVPRVPAGVAVVQILLAPAISGAASLGPSRRPLCSRCVTLELLESCISAVPQIANTRRGRIDEFCTITRKSRKGNSKRMWGLASPSAGRLYHPPEGHDPRIGR